MVVDNLSTDDSAAVATNLGAKVVRSSENRGFAAGNNLGLRLVESPLVAFVNPDVTVDAAALEVLGRHLRRHGGLVAPQLVDPDGQLQPNGRGWPTVWAKLRHRLSPGTGGYRKWPQSGKCKECVWVMGAFVASATATFRDIGGWNEDYFVYYEDAELGIRARANSQPVHVCDEVRAVHAWARDTSNLNHRAWRNEVRSALQFYRQHPRLLLPHRHGT